MVAAALVLPPDDQGHGGNATKRRSAADSRCEHHRAKKRPRQDGAHTTIENGSIPGRTRTCNLWLRRPTLYPIELRGRVYRGLPDCRRRTNPLQGRWIRTPGNPRGEECYRRHGPIATLFGPGHVSGIWRIAATSRIRNPLPAENIRWPQHVRGCPQIRNDRYSPSESPQSRPESMGCPKDRRKPGVELSDVGHIALRGKAIGTHGIAQSIRPRRGFEPVTSSPLAGRAGTVDEYEFP